MSRCFPYTPREGCVKRGTLRETLMGSLKLQKEKEKMADTKRSKPNKREKEKREILQKENEKAADAKRSKPNEREKERRGTHFKSLGINDSKLKRPSHERPPAGVRKRKVFDSESPPVSKDSTEQAEKSSITEEHEQPVGYLSDGSKSSSKSRQDASSSSIERCGNILRIRLKRTAAPESSPCGQPECTTSGTADLPPKYRHDTLSHAPCQISTTSADARLLVLEKPETSAPLDTPSRTIPSSRGNELSELESAYEALMENWVPLPLDHGLGEPDDEDWLFKTKRADGKSSKRPKVGDDVVIPSTWPPQAHYLPEAEIYALPYTVPF